MTISQFVKRSSARVYEFAARGVTTSDGGKFVALFFVRDNDRRSILIRMSESEARQLGESLSRYADALRDGDKVGGTVVLPPGAILVD